MKKNGFSSVCPFTRSVSPLRAGLHGFLGPWRRCNCARDTLLRSRRLRERAQTGAPAPDAARCRVAPVQEGNNHSASLRLALNPKNHALQPVQLRFLGLRPATTTSTSRTPTSAKRSATTRMNCWCNTRPSLRESRRHGTDSKASWLPRSRTTSGHMGRSHEYPTASARSAGRHPPTD